MSMVINQKTHFESVMLFTTKTLLKAICVAGCVWLLVGCTSLTSLMFYPLKNMPADPSYFGLQFKEIHHQAKDGTGLVSWWLPAQGDKPKGSILLLHGNAQNISYHQLSIHWLVKKGYNVFLLGYRQYGQSQGQAILPDVFLDVHSALDWMLDHHADSPVVMLGQSMGGSLAVYGLASYEKKEQVDALILDATFDSYPGMAAEAMSRSWITWLLQLPAYTITSEYDPVRWINTLNIPLLMFHSPQDETVPLAAGKRLFDQANQPKQWVRTHGRHVATYGFLEFRDITLDFLQNLPHIPEKAKD